MERPMQLNQQSLENIRNLPVRQRVPVLAIIAIHQKQSIKQASQQEAVFKKYTQRIKPLLERAAQLINGSPPKPQELAEIAHYLKGGQILGQLKGKSIDIYWSTVLLQSKLKKYITERDRQALEQVLNIQILEAFPSTISLRFVFKPNHFFYETTVVRILRIDNGKPAFMQGDMISVKVGQWLNYEPRQVMFEGVVGPLYIQGDRIPSFFDIFLNWNGDEHPKQLKKCADIMQELNQIVRDSLNHYLGQVGWQEFQDSSEEEEQQEDEEEEGDQEM